MTNVYYQCIGLYYLQKQTVATPFLLKTTLMFTDDFSFAVGAIDRLFASTWHQLHRSPDDFQFS